MMKHFKGELGIRMGAYIMRCKLEEAKSLLTYSEKSLAEISSYLCFSSQSYFQNVFKSNTVSHRSNTETDKKDGQTEAPASSTAIRQIRMAFFINSLL